MPTIKLEDNPPELFMGGYERFETPEYQRLAGYGPNGCSPPEDGPISLIDRNSAGWWVCRVKSRREKALAHELARRNLPYFLPLTCTRPKSNRSQPGLVPLLPDFIFLATPAFGPLVVQAPLQSDFQVTSDWRSRSIVLVEDVIKRTRDLSKHVLGFLHPRYGNRTRFAQELALLASQKANARTMEILKAEQREVSERLKAGQICKVVKGPFESLRCTVLCPEAKIADGKVKVVVNLSLMNRYLACELDANLLKPIYAVEDQKIQPGTTETKAYRTEVP